MKSTAQRMSWLQDINETPRTSMEGVLVDDEPITLPTHGKDDPRWQLAQRIVASRSFGKSAMLSQFLLYVCNRTLNGKIEEISEQQIGVHVFGRRPQYNPGEDNIVRNYARQLRQRLDAYFEEEGKEENLRLSIPRGTYVPTFTEHKVAVASQVDDASAVVAATVDKPNHVQTSSVLIETSRFQAYGLCAVLVVIAIALVWIAIPHHVTHAESDPSHALWSQIFSSKQTFLVPADDGIVMFQNLTGHSVHLAEYVNRNYMLTADPVRIDPRNLLDLDSQRYTSIADLDAVLKFSRLAEVAPDRVLVRYARELHMDDLKDANAVLLGSSYSNPWVELFQKNLNFEFTYKPEPNLSHITNKHPLAGESAEYANDAVAPSHTTYAVVALTPNLNNAGWVLMIEGLTMAGTQAAVETLFNRSAMQPILARARIGNGVRPFEILIETKSFGSNAPQANVIASRFY